MPLNDIDNLITIEKFNKKGNGVGEISINNSLKTVEAPFSIPGDQIFSTSPIKKSKTKLKLYEISNFSKKRITPKCLHFGICGGCRWQQMSYSDQLSHKQKAVETYFSSILPDGLKINEIIPSTEWNYRNKMEYTFSSDSKKEKYLGLIKSGSKGHVINLTECHLVNPWFIQTLDSVRNWWLKTDLDAYHPYKNIGSLRTLVLREGIRSGDRLAMLTVSGNPEYALNKSQLESFVKAVRESAELNDGKSKLSIFLRIQQLAKGMPTNFYEMLLYGPDYIRETLNVQISPDMPPQQLTFHISPTAFFQPNSVQAEKLYSTALQMAKIEKGSIVYDLYCGTGTLGLCAAKNAERVYSIEVSPESALDAKTNATLNSIENITILSGAVRHLLKQIKEEKKYPLPDLVVIDPPRSGMDPESMQGLLNLNAPKILYISCCPETQSQNVAELIKNGYQIVAVQPIDQFAQTPHIENIVILEKKSENVCP